MPAMSDKDFQTLVDLTVKYGRGLTSYLKVNEKRDERVREYMDFMTQENFRELIGYFNDRNKIAAIKLYRYNSYNVHIELMEAKNYVDKLFGEEN